VEENFDTMFLV